MAYWVLEVLRRQLKKEGCITYVANNGQQALDFICNETIFSQRLRNSHQDHMSREEILPEKELDIVLMDMEMPIMGESLDHSSILMQY